jgi:4a-hydroxytetrahydrobiopterin dehydratase
MDNPAGWAEREAALERDFRFDSFAEAIAFVNGLAALAERENHHPDIRIRFSSVTVRWSTHTAGAVTDRDRRLAALTDELG